MLESSKLVACGVMSSCSIPKSVPCWCMEMQSRLRAVFASGCMTHCHSSQFFGGRSPFGNMGSMGGMGPMGGGHDDFGGGGFGSMFGPGMGGFSGGGPMGGVPASHLLFSWCYSGPA